MNNLVKITIAGILLVPAVIHSCKKEDMPELTTTAVTNITGTTAASGGTITNEGSETVTDRGVCWSKTTNPTTADNRTDEGGGTGTFTSTMTNLDAVTKYYVRAYASSKAGTVYGNEISFQTAPHQITFNDLVTYGSMIDQEGNSYRTVKIGEQTWMAENLRTTHYQDGTPIPNMTSYDSWTSLTNGAFCFYENDTLNKNVYGALYNWYTVADQRKLCPDGWHIPSDAEWSVLENSLGGSDIAGMKMKEVGVRHWVSPNFGASNISGFTALPSGSRSYSVEDDFLGLRYYCMWWSSTEHHTFTNSAWYRFLNTFEIVSERSYYLKRVGYSVRCLMD